MKSKLFTTQNIVYVIISAMIFITFGMLSTGSVGYKSWAFALSIIALICAFIKIDDNKLYSKIGISVSAYMAILGISTIYANSGKFAISEYVKYLIGFTVFLFVISAGKDAVKKIVWILTTIVAITAFLSIEGASLGLIQPNIEIMMYGSNIAEYAQFYGSRISSIFGNANVFTTMLGTALFMSLYLIISSTNKYQRYIQSFYIILFSNAVLLSFSMAGTFSLAVSVLIYLAFCKKEQLLKNLMTILLAVIISAVCVSLTLGTYVNREVSGSIMPILAIIIGSAIFAFLYEKVLKNMGQKENSLKIYKNILIIFGGIIALVIAFTAIAFNITTSQTITSNSNFTRVVYLDEGKHTINVEYENPENTGRLTIYGSDLEGTILNQRDVILQTVQLKDGNQSFEFYVGEEIEEVTIIIRNNSSVNAVLSNVQIESSNKIIDVPLDYVLLPDNIVTRLQGIRTNNSLITRIQYNKDSLKLFALSPIYGHGLGGFENAVQMVQSYQYETKYAHNHFAQSIVDTGLIGFLAYASIVVFCASAVIKTRKESDISIPLLGSLAMIVVHGSTEISMSSAFFVPIAFAIFGLILISTHDKPCFDNKNRYTTIATSGVIAIFLVLLMGNIQGNKLISNGQITLDILTKAATIDIYEKNDYMLSYVLATTNIEDAKVQATSQKYLVKLEKASSNTISRYLCKYYLDIGNNEKAFEQINIYINRAIQDVDTWDNAFAVYGSFLFNDAQIGYTHMNIDTYLSQMNELLDLFNQINEKTVGTMELSENSQMLFVELENIKKNNMFK